MKSNDPLLKTILPEVITDQEVDFTRLVVADEFRRHRAKDYRDAAIDRLILAGVPFYNETNITYNLMRRFLAVTCPYCSREMKAGSGGGGSSEWSTDYKCDNCGASASVAVNHNSGIHFTKGVK